VDRITKWGYFIPCTEEILVENVAYIYIREVFLRHRLLKKIISNRDPRFIAVFWEVFLAKQRV